MARRRASDAGDAGATRDSAVARPGSGFDPASALRPSRADAYTVLVLWCARKSFVPLLWIGLAIAVWALRDVDAVLAEVAVLGDLEAMASDLLSPFALVVIAITVRILTAWTALAAAYPMTRWTRPTDYAHGRRKRSWIGLWWDRLHLARGFRSLRWTGPVRRVAEQRLGAVGEAFRMANRVITWIGLVSFVGFVVVLIAVDG